MSDFDPDAMNSITGIFGKRKTGKTLYVKGDESLKIKGVIRTYLAKGMKVLIVDTIDHPSWRDVPIIAPDQLKIWKKGCYRIFVRRERIPELCALLSEVLWNGLIIFEDAHKHPDSRRGRLNDNIMALFGDSKQKNVDIILMYHNWALAPKDLYRYLDYIKVFKTKDHPSCREEDMPDYYDIALAVYERVKAHPSRFHSELIKTDL